MPLGRPTDRARATVPDAMSGEVPVIGFVSGIDPALLWVIGGLVGLILEMLVPAFVIGSFGVSAIIAGAAAALGADQGVQIALFAGLGFAFAVPARRFLHRRARRGARGRGRHDSGASGRRNEPREGDDGDG